MEELPDDALVKVFSYLSFNDLVHSVQNVCCRWKSIMQYADLWKTVVYMPDFKETDNQIVSNLQQIPKLQILILKRRGVGASVLYTILDNCSYLKRLEFNSDQKLSINFLNKLVLNCPNLEYLLVPNDVLNREKCSEAIAQFNNLRTLVVGKLAHWDCPAKLKPLANGCPALKHLDLRNDSHVHEDMAYFLCQKSGQLETLSVSWASADCKCVIPLLASCKGLKSLTVDSYCDGYVNDVEDIYIQPYFESFWALKTVTSLTLNSLYNAKLQDIESIFRDRAMSQLRELQIMRFKGYNDRLCNVIIENCPKLELLHFKWCERLTDMSVKHLNMLSKLNNLDICSSVITERGITYISECHSLKYLSLSHFRELNEKGLMQLLKFKNLQVLKLVVCDLKGLPYHLFPSHLKKLTSLNMSFCRNVNRKALMQLKVDMPRLIIRDKLCDDDENESSKQAWWHDCVRQTSQHTTPCTFLEEAPFMVQQLKGH